MPAIIHYIMPSIQIDPLFHPHAHIITKLNTLKSSIYSTQKLPSSSSLPQSHCIQLGISKYLLKSNMSRNESPSATLDSFIIGLSHQIPPSKLSTMVSGEGIQRLFLERSTEALPMGSKIRNSVGSIFDEALHLLQLEMLLQQATNC